MAGNLKGNLIDVGLLEIFQLLMNSKATGVLNVKGKGVSFKIFFDKGKVVSADSGKSSGLDALIDAVLLETGYFEFVKGWVDKNNEFSKSTESLIADLFQIDKQWKNIKKIFNGGKQAIPVLSSLEKSEVSLKKEEFKVISYINGKKSVEEIARDVGLSIFEISEILYELYKKSLYYPEE